VHSAQRERERDRADAARGEPVSLALRVPEVLEAIRRAAAAPLRNGFEFFQRVPVARWYEAIITPIELEGIAPHRRRRSCS